MYRSIGRRLILKSLWAFLLIALLIVAGQVIVSIFQDTSNEMVVEYHEMNALQELNLSFANLLIAIDRYPDETDRFDTVSFKALLQDAFKKLKHGKEVITASHNPAKLDRFEEELRTIESLSNSMFQLQFKDDDRLLNDYLHEIRIMIQAMIFEGGLLVNETKAEISSYEVIYNTVVNHGRTTILSLGALIIVVILLLGWLLIRNITKPIKELAIATKRISDGDHKTKVKIDTQDEFNQLADSFNAMVDSLNETTVSKNYLDNILAQMFNALAVTDENLMIRSLNEATLKLLDYQEEDLLGQHINVLFGENTLPKQLHLESPSAPEEWKISIEKLKGFKTRAGNIIPSLLSCSLLKSHSNHFEGLIVVGHDLREQKAMEKKIEQIRKERLIELNEAQEEEKMRIARDLHDGLGQILTAISYTVSEFHQEENLEVQAANALIEKTQQQINVAIRETKNLAHNLIPIVLKDYGLIAAIDGLIQRANETYPIHFTFNAFDFKDRIDPKLEKSIYRICQEAMNNIVKHSKAERAIFQIYRQYGQIVLVIEDDGIGFDPEAIKIKKNRGIGLISLKERVDAFNGTLTINAKIGDGTEIIIELPCRK